MKKSHIFLISFLAFIYSQLIFPQNLWQPSGNLSGKAINKLIFDYSGNFFALTTNEIYRSTDNGNSWHLFTNFYEDFYIEEITFNRNDIPFIIASDSSGRKVYRSTDEGVSWLPVNTNVSFGYRGGLTTNIDYTMYVTGFAIYKSTDDGESWADLGFWYGGSVINIIHDSTGNLYWHKDNHGMYQNEVYRSTDSGLSWSSILLIGIDAFGCNKSGLIFISGMHWNIPVGPYTFKSTDYGNNWNIVNEYSYHSLTVTGDGEVYGYNVDYEMQFCSDEGETWIDYNSGLPTGDIRTLVIDTSGYLFAGTSDGVYRTVSQVTSLESGDGELPTEYFLSQNYPNPFNPSTTIMYSIPKGENIGLKVFDILGNELTTLVNEYKAAGKHGVEFDGSSLPSGIYFYQLNAGNFTQTKKLLLLK